MNGDETRSRVKFHGDAKDGKGAIGRARAYAGILGDVPRRSPRPIYRPALRRSAASPLPEGVLSRW